MLQAHMVELVAEIVHERNRPRLLLRGEPFEFRELQLRLEDPPSCLFKLLFMRVFLFTEDDRRFLFLLYRGPGVGKFVTARPGVGRVEH